MLYRAVQTFMYISSTDYSLVIKIIIIINNKQIIKQIIIKRITNMSKVKILIMMITKLTASTSGNDNEGNFHKSIFPLNNSQAMIHIL